MSPNQNIGHKLVPVHAFLTAPFGLPCCQARRFEWIGAMPLTPQAALYRLETNRPMHNWMGLLVFSTRSLLC